MIAITEPVEETNMSSKYNKKYEALVDLVGHEHWIAIYEDGRRRKNIRIISGEDAWKFDIQVDMTVEVESRPHNRCKIIRGLSRPN